MSFHALALSVWCPGHGLSLQWMMPLMEHKEVLLAGKLYSFVIRGEHATRHLSMAMLSVLQPTAKDSR